MHNSQKIKRIVIAALSLCVLTFAGTIGLIYQSWLFPRRINSSLVLLKPEGCSVASKANIPVETTEGQCGVQGYADLSSPGVVTISHNQPKKPPISLTVPVSDLVGVILK